MQEIWKDIKGYEELYQVSNLGRIQNKKTLHILKGSTNNKGYRGVILCKNGKIKRYLVHRLVAIAFIENPKNKPYINHLDCNINNNNVENLEWCTQKENIDYCIKLNRNYKRKVYQYDLKGNLLQEYSSIVQANKVTKISTAHISQNCNNQRKSAGMYIWSFKKNIKGIKEYKRETRAKKIVQILDNQIVNTFDSIKEAEEKTGILKTSISNCLTNRSKSAGKYNWKYKEEI